MKPELLLPVGNQEAFFAAIQGGADAVYLGLQDFNARNRAKNFTFNQFYSLKKEAEKNNVKVYLTLNTIVKNSEMEELLQTLNTVNQLKPDAVIIQDLGVFYLLKKYFPELKIHASTQMAFHNSVGANYAADKGFERVILYRELTLEELDAISARTKTELEIFAHGALCYSFSGHCLFSSYLGGMSANRGLCRQPCRRKYVTENKEEYFFNLKDLQLIEYVPQLIKLKTKSIKIEGRMKSAEYVYQVARAYRMAIDNPEKIDEAVQILKMDLAREKTSYFFGGNVSEAISESPYTGFQIGEIERIVKNGVTFKAQIALKKRDRIRIMSSVGENTDAIKLNELKVLKDNEINEVEQINIGDEVFVQVNRKVKTGERIFLVGMGKLKFNTKLPKIKKMFHRDKSLSKMVNFRRQTLNKSQLFFRIDNRKWMQKIFFDKIDGLILKLSKEEIQRIHINKPFLKNNIHKLHFELPKFIPEKEMALYKREINRLYKQGIKNFVIGHISQKALFFKKNVNIIANESIYVMNDFAAKYLVEEKIDSFIYPFESDFDNLEKFAERRGFVPIYFKPELFYSRMPVRIDDTHFKDNKYGYEHIRADGMTKVLPDRPVAITQFKGEIMKLGYKRFLVDFSYEKPSKNLFNLILKNWQIGKAMQPSSHFNFKLGLH